MRQTPLREKRFYRMPEASCNKLAELLRPKLEKKRLFIYNTNTLSNKLLYLVPLCSTTTTRTPPEWASIAMRRAGGLLQRRSPGFLVCPEAKGHVRISPERKSYWYEQGSRVRQFLLKQ